MNDAAAPPPRRGLEHLNRVIERARAALGIDPQHADELTVAELAHAERERDRIERTERRRQRLRSLGHPLPITLEMQTAIAHSSLTHTAAMLSVMAWAHAGKPRVLVLTGVTGSGKSVAAAALCSRGQGARWMSATSLAALYLSDHYETVERRHWLQQAKLLVIDGLGDELRERAPHVTEALLDQIAHRTDGRTLITTRYEWQGLRARYQSEPLWGLMQQIARHEPVRTPDLRIPPKAP